MTTNIQTLVDDDFMQAAEVTDTWLGLQVGLSGFPRGVFPATAPIVLLSQIYNSVNNRTDVDRDIDQLKRQGTIHIFKLLSGKNDYAVVLKEDYINSIRKKAEQSLQKTTAAQQSTTVQQSPQMNNTTTRTAQQSPQKGTSEQPHSVFEQFIKYVISDYSDVQISKSKLLNYLHKDNNINNKDKGKEKSNSAAQNNGQDDDAITLLVNAGLLLIHEVDNFWFSIPSSGLFVASLVKGRKEIISILKRQKFKEMLFMDLVKRKLRYSSLSIEFLLKDMCGLNILESFMTCLLSIANIKWLSFTTNHHDNGNRSR